MAMIDIFCNGVKIQPMGEGLTLSLNGGIFADLVRSYSTSFDVVRTPDVNEALGLTGAIYNFLQRQLKAVPCDICINGHNQYGTLQVESLTPTTASLTLYVVVIGLEESVLAMTLPELAWRASGYNDAVVPVGAAKHPTIGQVLATGTKFSEYQNGFSNPSDVTVWKWQFPVTAVSEILNYINQQQPSLDLTPIASATVGVNVLANSFFIPLNAPATIYVEMDSGWRGYYQRSISIFPELYIINPPYYRFRFARAGVVVVNFNYYYAQSDSTNRYITFSGVHSYSLYLAPTGYPSSVSYSFTVNVNAGDVLAMAFPQHSSDFTFAANIEATTNITTPLEGDFFVPYERGTTPTTMLYTNYFVPNNRPAFFYVNYYSSLPKITVREFLSALLKLCGLSATVSIETTEIEGTIDAMHPDNDINGTQNGCIVTMADGSVVYDVEPTSEGGNKNEIEVALWQAIGEPDTAAGNMLTAVVQNFEHSYGTPDIPTTYIDSTKSREGAMVLTTDAMYNGNSVQQAYDAKGALYANFGQYLDDVRLKPTADITAWRLREWVLFPDIIYINGWRVYVTESSIDTDTGFYTFKGILTE